MPVLDPILLTAFVVASVVVIVMPGPDLVFVAAQSIGRGRRAGIIASLGTCSGLLVHATAAVLGLSSLFAVAPLAFEAVRWTGVAYLLWLAVQSFRAGGAETAAEPARAQKTAALTIWRQAALTNVLNPKVAIFFIAFFPQFTSPAHGPIALQMAWLAALFVVLGLGFLLIFASLCARFGDLLRDRPSFARLQRWLMGSTFGGLALWLAIGERR
jgi:threonine/homoserine/homoserine lactone efflux protein